MNPAIQQALARAAALKQALMGAAGNAGHFIGNEVQGTLANLAPSAVAQRYTDVAAAPAARDNAIVKAQGYPGGMDQFLASPAGSQHIPDSTNMLGDFISKIANLRTLFKRK